MRKVEVAFANENLKKAYVELSGGKFEEKRLVEFIERAISDLKQNPFCGIRIAKKLWPKIYIRKYEIDNLWKYNLPNAWRLIYTVVGDDVIVKDISLSLISQRQNRKKLMSLTIRLLE